MIMENKKENNGWILCSDQLPIIDDREYNVIIKGAIRPTTLFYSDNHWYDEYDHRRLNFYNVYAWQPLPDVPDKFINELRKEVIYADRERIVRELDDIEYIKLDSNTVFIKKDEVLNIINDLPFY